MRRALLLSLLLCGALFSGCTGPGDKDPEVDDPEAGPAGPSAKGPDEEDPPDPPKDPHQDLAPTSHLFDLRETDYQASLKRYELVAKSDLDLSVVWDVAVGQYAGEEDCAVLAVQIPAETGQGTSNKSLSIVTWAWRNNIAYNELTLAGERNPIGLDLTQDMTGGIGVKSRDGTSSIVPQGHRVIVEIGGLTGAMADGEHQSADQPSQSEENRFTLNLTYTGEAELKELEAAPIRCGMSPHQAQGSLLGVHGYPQLVVDGSITMETRTNSTLLVLQPPSFFTPAQEFRTRFLGEAHENPRELGLSRDQGGTLAIEFAHWMEITPTSPVWFMADIHWPWIEQVFDQEG